MSFQPYLLSVCALILAGCSSADLPRPRVAEYSSAAPGPGVIMSGTLMQALREAEQASTALDTEQGVAAYNAGVEKVVTKLQSGVSPHAWQAPLTVAGSEGGTTYEISFHRGSEAVQGQPEYSPALFDSFVPASSFDLRSYQHRAGVKGAGAAFVLAFEDVERLRKERAFRASNGIYSAGTAVLKFGRRQGVAGVVPVTLQFLNPTRAGKVQISGRTLPLAADYSAMVEMNLNNDYIRGRGLAGMLRPGEHLKDLGLFALERFDPAKIPVVFVHGLCSDPGIWRYAVNELYADPVLKARYQPLLYVYPTGLNVPAAAVHLRKRLEAYRDLWDPHHRSANFSRMVIVGHSMGGLLSRLQVIDSGEDLRSAFFSEPLEKLPWLQEPMLGQLKQALQFQARPFVKRAIFVAVPHRGSHIADMGIVQLAVRLIRLPVSAAVTAAGVVKSGMSSLNPALSRYRSLGLRSVDMLSPEHPYFHALEKRRIKVPFHSIIGNRGKSGSAEQSDGAVPFWSSHLDGAESELIVPHGHSCTEMPEVVAEISRILHLHLGSKAR